MRQRFVAGKGNVMLKMVGIHLVVCVLVVDVSAAVPARTWQQPRQSRCGIKGRNCCKAWEQTPDGYTCVKIAPCDAGCSSTRTQATPITCRCGDRATQKNPLACPCRGRANQRTPRICPCADRTNRGTTLTCPCGDKTTQRTNRTCPCRVLANQRTPLACPCGGRATQGTLSTPVTSTLAPRIQTFYGDCRRSLRACHHLCRPVDRFSFRCQCHPGYTDSGDGRSCLRNKATASSYQTSTVSSY